MRKNARRGIEPMTYEKQGLFVDEAHLEHYAENLARGWKLTGEMCPECGRPLAKKHGRFGDFLACTGFPDCRYTRSIIKGTGVKCPKCGGEIIQKTSRKGKPFFGCSNYPKCDQVYWYRPVDKKCPRCGSLLVQRGRSLVCSNQECGYSERKPAEAEK